MHHCLLRRSHTFHFGVGAALVVLCAMGSLPVRAAAASAWHTDFSSAWKEAQRLDCPLLIHFYATWCGPCRLMERDVLNDRRLLARLGRTLVAVKIDSDRHPDLVRRFGVRALPSDVIVVPDGRVLSQTQGYRDLDSYLSRVVRAETRYAEARRLRVAGKAAASAEGDSDEKTARSEEKTADGSRPGPDSARESGPRAEDAVVGLEGYSPVALFESRQWKRGKKRFAATYQGIVYYLQDAAERERFERQPSRYAPRLLGCDPVLLMETDRAIPGSIRFGAYFDGHLYLFQSASTRERFKRAPRQYTRTRQVRRDELPQRIAFR